MTKSPEFPQAFQALSQPIFRPHERLAAFREFYNAGVMRALQDALTFCDELADEEGGATVPRWILAAARDLVIERIEKGKTIGKGKHGNDSAVYFDHQKHLLRYLRVRALMNTGVTLEEAYQPASEGLKGTSAEGGEDTIRTSYKKVQKALKDPKEAMRLYPYRGFVVD
ncbi:hypothetical protein NKH36_18075 [Mesorhizobium sp. M1312]|uniref:hypothetical protein n=1 Tax=unclassified Mesorhizobium TaxID=325217 RepID=UPI00333C7067